MSTSTPTEGQPQKFTNRKAQRNQRQQQKQQQQQQQQQESSQNPDQQNQQGQQQQQQQQQQPQPTQPQQGQQPKQGQPQQQNQGQQNQRQRRGKGQQGQSQQGQQNQPNQGQQNQQNQSQQQNQQNQGKQGQNASQDSQKAKTTAPAQPVSEITSLFSHIPIVHKWTSKDLLDQMRPSDRPLIHPALLEFALQTAQDISLDEDERTRKFLRMMKIQINDEPVDPKETLQRTIFLLIKRTMNLLSLIRLTPIGIGNAVRFIKSQLTEMSQEPEEFRTAIKAAIDHFIEDKIDDVSQFLAKSTAATIVDGDVIMTYGWSPVICKAMKIAANNKIKFRVIVVDSRPNFDSRTLIEQISDLDVRYVLISGLSYVMPEVKKVLIEPNGILSNNAAQTPIGTAMISMVAHECGVPVIFVCGSYRFVSDVRIDALSKNERIAQELIQPVPRNDMKTDSEYLALTYDVTPGQYVDVVICELGSIPVNSISTIIKFIQDSYTMFSKPQSKSTAAK